MIIPALPESLSAQEDFSPLPEKAKPSLFGGPQALRSCLETPELSSHAHQCKFDQKRNDGIRDDLRLRLAQRLHDEGAHELALELDECNQPFTMRCMDCDQPKKARTQCKRRWCPCCARRIAAQQSARYEGLVAEMEWPIFITLTVKNYDDSEVGFVREMMRAFGKLRKLRWWGRAVKGGIAKCEVTNIGNGWHPHLHAVIDCKWLAVREGAPPIGCSAEAFRARCKRAAKEVSEQWSLAIGRSGNVKTKRAFARSSERGESIAKEVLKYSVKAADILESKEPARVIIEEMIGTRMLRAFGTCYGRLTEFDEPPRICTCSHCGGTGPFVPSDDDREIRRELHP